MLEYDLIDYGLRVVGELTEPGHDLPWRRNAKLYISVPKSWPIPPSYTDRIMPDGALGVTDANLISLKGDFRVLLGNVVREDWRRASRQVYWFTHRVQQVFWTALFSKGVIIAFEDYGPHPTSLCAPFNEEVWIRFLIPKSLSHKLPDDVPDAKKYMHLNEHQIFYCPVEPANRDDYDEYLYGALDKDKFYTGKDATCFKQAPFFFDFEAVRVAIQGIINA
ncbi:MAG: hypothetical protein IJQ35_05185 [Bacteroidales bacterium]|nr:hypothetical protein [Bacteroidales bacterium]